MNVLKKLEEVVPNKAYLGFAKLTLGHHQILCFRTVKNKFGKKGDGSSKSILIELEDQVLFLPQYFNQKITESDITELNSNIEKNVNVYLYFGGRDERTNAWIIRIVGKEQMLREKKQMFESSDEEEEEPIVASQSRKQGKKAKPVASAGTASKKKKKNDGMVQESQTIEDSDSDTE